MYFIGRNLTKVEGTKDDFPERGKTSVHHRDLLRLWLLSARSKRPISSTGQKGQEGLWTRDAELRRLRRENSRGSRILAHPATLSLEPEPPSYHHRLFFMHSRCSKSRVDAGWIGGRLNAPTHPSHRPSWTFTFLFFCRLEFRIPIANRHTVELCWLFPRQFF